MTISYSHLRSIYNGTSGNISGKTVTPVQYEYYSYAEQEFARFLRLNDQPWDKGTWQLASTAIGKKDDKAVRDYISSNANTIGFLPLGFATGGVASEGKTSVISAYIDFNKIAPGVTSALDHRHDAAAYVAPGNAVTLKNARTVYPSACLGAIFARGETTYLGGAHNDNNIHACLNEKIFYYTKGSPTGATKAFIDYSTSPAGQKDIAAAGFVPLLK